MLGLGAGAIYTLLAQGIVLTYRGSGIVNFSQSAIAMVSAYVFWDLNVNNGVSLWLSILAGVATGTVIGGLIYVLVIKRMAGSAALVRVIATLGVLTVLSISAKLFWGGDQQIVSSFIPVKLWIVGGVRMTSDRIVLTLIAVVVTAICWLIYRYTRFGLAVQAAAEDERGAAALGWSPDFLAVVNWAAGGALAGLAGVLVTPITGLQIDSLTLILIPAMAAALLGTFSSFWLTLVGGMGIGIIQSEIGRYTTVLGLADAVPFLVIVAILVVRGKTLPLRSHLLDHLPRLGPGRLSPRLLAVPALLAVLAVFAFSDYWNNALITSLAFSVILMSVVVLTGFAGQVSLAQVAMGGLAALVTGRLIENQTLPFPIAMVLGILAAIPIGLVFALPALRTRGINLAIVTLGLGLAVDSVVFQNPNYTGGPNGIAVGTTSFFGLNITASHHPSRYAVFCLVVVVLCIMAVLNVRRSRAGRRLIAVRTNERAAASLGVNVFGAKLYAFAISAALAGIGGILLGFQNPVIVYQNFDPFTSITVVELAVIGGLGYALGAINGSVIVVGGVGMLVTNWMGISSDWLVLVAGVGLLIQLMLVPDGIASMHDPTRKKKPKKGSKGDAVEPQRASAPRIADVELVHEKVAAAELRVQGVSVVLGGTQILSNVDLKVTTGQIMGLIGPNGAGKTTLIDAVTGFVKPSSGEIYLDGREVSGWSASRRSKMGMSRSFQSLELFEDVSVRDNILAGADRYGIRPYLTDVFWPRKDDFTPTALRAIKEFDLEGDLDRTPGELPYGRRRLVSIARSLAAEPSILLLDEPAAGLSDAETAELRGLLRRLVEEWGIGILLVEHDMSLVMAVCDWVVALDRGEVIGTGDPEAVSSNQQVREAYLGDSVPQAG